MSIGPYIYAIRTITLQHCPGRSRDHRPCQGLPERRVRNRHILRGRTADCHRADLWAGRFASGSINLVETVLTGRAWGVSITIPSPAPPDENVIVALTFVFTLMYVGIRILLEVLYIFWTRGCGIVSRTVDSGQSGSVQWGNLNTTIK
ncbi:MAG: hypothetical protein R2867_38625 [Caldilineaceae bacterium]